MENREGSIEFSIFIDNLPHNQDPIELRRIFSRFGRVTDAYIPRKLRTKSRRTFGFIRFSSKQAADCAVQVMNGTFINQHKIFVAWARFQKSTKNNGRGSEWTRIRIMSQEGRSDVKTLTEVDGALSVSTVEWLKKSLVCHSDHPRDASCLANAILFELPMCLKATDMGMFKFILTFESQEEALSVLQEYRDILSYRFRVVNPWDDLEVLLQVQGKGFRVFIQEAKASVCLGKIKQTHDQAVKKSTPSYQSSDEEDDHYLSPEVNCEEVEQPSQIDDSERILDSYQQGKEFQKSPNEISDSREEEHCLGDATQNF
ncbi:hypothetical protein Cgig2_020577 [Carnegiea gigantea]|uniref:RRM domain-containing protein n=1 Tax=Carnegiea gigantea TaxID=171969 RepID=A0A9Q1JY32_9CARY|nr:hypothetical protein Cgig2_020577 [Carnegiea gigantea]